MPRADHCHWVCEAGDNWAKVAAKLGVTRRDLLTANNETVENPSNLTAGRVIHVPPT